MIGSCLQFSEISIKMICLQIFHGADILQKDINKRNVLHLVVINGGRLQEFAASCQVGLSDTVTGASREHTSLIGFTLTAPTVHAIGFQSVRYRVHTKNICYNGIIKMSVTSIKVV